MNFYPNQIRAILVYIETLDEAEKKLAALGNENTPYPRVIELEDSDGTKYGQLRDEIGGAWSWEPPSG